MEERQDRTAPNAGNENAPLLSLPPLSEHGSTGSELDGMLRDRGVRDEESLRRFLSAWLTGHIAAVHLPIIRWARECATRSDADGLVELDCGLSSLPLHEEVRRASVRIGQRELLGLPVKGHRFVKRYQEAVESGRADGNHAVVYGVYLFLFSVSLREGLLSYAYQTVQALAEAAAGRSQLRLEQTRGLVNEVCAGLPKQVESSLGVKREQILPSLTTSIEPGARAER